MAYADRQNQKGAALGDLAVPPSGSTQLRTPAHPTPATQPWWNRQCGSSMPFDRYERDTQTAVYKPVTRLWPTRTIDRAPLWSSVDLRDGNQALPNPMDTRRKGLMFDLLVRIGFKDIEVGYPSASQVDFDFVRSLVEEDRIPDDVTIGVFTPARLDLIDRTFEAIRGVDRAVVHLCNATACLWRDVVFGMSASEVRRMADTAAHHMVRRADEFGPTRIRFEYSPETFNMTEPEFALEVCNSVAAICGAAPDRPLILNLPTTVETDSPNMFADQVEWMHRNLDNRASIILSVHPHNDRGTAVASAELALMSEADRIEGTLFGNGERTGNACLATLALNLYSRGIDPQLDFSDIDAVRATVEYCNQIQVHPRHPYVGDLVYTAFSGTHQDAIAKGMAALERCAKEQDVDARSVTWKVPYLPIDPKDVGRGYESVVRLNSQSGKGGIAHVLKTHHRLDLPKPLQSDFANAVQRIVDASGFELSPSELWDVFCQEYLDIETPLLLKEFEEQHDDFALVITATASIAEGREMKLRGFGRDVPSALIDGMRRAGYPFELFDMTTQTVTERHETPTVTYCDLLLDQKHWFGVGLDQSATTAALRAVVSAVNRALSRAAIRLPTTDLGLRNQFA
jgi:2-isopropylmalate synthase